jgi:hypothetical protein
MQFLALQRLRELNAPQGWKQQQVPKPCVSYIELFDAIYLKRDVPKEMYRLIHSRIVMLEITHQLCRELLTKADSSSKYFKKPQD